VIQYIIAPDRDLVMIAVKQNGLSIEHFTFEEMEYENVDDIYLEAVKQNGLALKMITTKNKEIIMEAVKQNGYAIKYVPRQTFDLCVLSIENSHFVDSKYNKLGKQEKLRCIKSVATRKKFGRDE